MRAFHWELRLFLPYRVERSVAQAAKAMKLVSRPAWRRAAVRGVAATTEHRALEDSHAGDHCNELLPQVHAAPPLEL